MADFGIGETIALVSSLTAAAAGTATATYGAVKANDAAKKASEAAKAKAQAQVRQIADAAQLERKKRELDAERVRGRLAVLGAESGVAGGYNSLEQQVNTDLNDNLSIIAKNVELQTGRVAAGYNADLTTFNNQRVNPVIASATGALSGLSTGLSIGSAINSIPTTP